MDRGNSKHGRIVDEQMEQEARNLRHGTVDPHSDEIDETDDVGDLGEVGDEELSRLGRYIPRTSLPGNRDDLLVGASHMHAPDEIIELLKGLPAQEKFRTVAEVWATLRN
jgi:hypothetical protein